MTPQARLRCRLTPLSADEGKRLRAFFQEAGYDLDTLRGGLGFSDLASFRVRPAVAILAIDPDNPTRWLEVRGTVVGETEEGANEHIDELARLYLGVDKYPFH